ncbi:response regulator [Flavobacterium tibetense]|nr:response regulator [Flavobacterium tibetense]
MLEKQQHFSYKNLTLISSIMKTFEILLAEDNEGDIVLTIESLEDSKLIKNINVVKNGKDAVDFIMKEGNYVMANRPDLILLDVNLPLKNGYEVLKIIKNNEKTKQIPVIMLTTSSSEEDINLSISNHANAFITKPIEPENYSNIRTKVENFLLKINSVKINKKS